MSNLQVADKHTSNKAELVNTNPGLQIVLSSDLTDHPKDLEDWRRRLSRVEESNLENELEFVAAVAEKDANSYHLWRYRRCIAMKMGTAAKRELEFTAKILSEDRKNFHAWSHRKWVLKQLGGKWENELRYCDKILSEDVSNTFAWSQRLFIVTRYCATSKMRKDEVYYASRAIKVKPEDPSPWRYLKDVCNNDMNILFEAIYPETTYGKVLMDAADRAKSFFEKDAVVFRGFEPHAILGASIRKRGCNHALNLIAELMDHGYSPRGELKEAIKFLFRVLKWESDPSSKDVVKKFVESWERNLELEWVI